MNHDRMERARQALADYAEAVGDPQADAGTTLGDLLTDLLHLCGPEVVAVCLRTATMHYEAEREEEAA